MSRLPIVATVRDAYVFVFTHVGAIIGLIWVPMLLLTVTGFFTLHQYYNDMIDALAAGNPAQMGPSILMMLGYLVAALLFYAVVYVAVVQLALGTRSGGAMVYFAFGALEWRMFRALAGFVGLMVVFSFLILILGNGLMGTLTAKGHLSQMSASGVLVLLLYGALALLSCRFLILLPAVAVSETAPVLRRTWALSTGNFLPLLGVMIAVFLPAGLVMIAAGLVDNGSAQVPQVLPSAAQQAQLTAALLQERQALPLICGLGFLVAPLVVGLLAGASVSAWRRLSGNVEAVTPA